MASCLLTRVAFNILYFALIRIMSLPLPASR